MKKIILLTVLLISVNTFSFTRPTNEWLLIYDNNETAIIEADNIGEALEGFRKEYPDRRIFSAAQRSYVQSIWIWKK